MDFTLKLAVLFLIFGSVMTIILAVVILRDKAMHWIIRAFVAIVTVFAIAAVIAVIRMVANQ